MFLYYCILLVSCVSAKPNIIFILIDDLGYYDTGITNPEAIMPTLVELAQQGTFLNQSYVQPYCTPSRSALLSGKYPFRTGMQGNPITPTQPRCLNTSLTLLPEKLHDLGYRTHGVGKWHLGFCDFACTPTHRGFDSFVGLYNSYFDHYTHIRTNPGNNKTLSGVDFNINNELDNSTSGIHSTVMFIDQAEQVILQHDESDPLFLWLALPTVHFPIQVPTEYERLYKHIDDEDRRILLGMVTQMDDGVKVIVDALQEKNMVDNTLLVFMSDNGGDPTYGGYNYPLRGRKSGIFEGGVRSQTLLWGGALNQASDVNDGLMHAVDWFPTLVSLAGGDTADLDLDGVDNSEMILDGGESNRYEMVYQINEVRDPFEAAIRSGPYKFLIGDLGDSDWIIPPELNGGGHFEEVDAVDIHRNKDQKLYYPEEWDRFLFNIEDDPEERYNLINDLPEIAEELERLLAEYDQERIDFINPPSTPEVADPDLFGGYWYPGWCDM